MNITFTAKNGFCPTFIYGDAIYVLREHQEGVWQLMSKKIGHVRKSRFYKSDRVNIQPREVLDRYFRNKKGYRYDRTGEYSTYYWNGLMYMASNTGIVVLYEEKPIGGIMDSYRECLEFAKKYLGRIIEEQEKKDKEEGNQMKYSDDLIVKKVDRKIKTRTKKYMDEYNLSLADAFNEAVRELAKEGTDLWKAWYHCDLREYIPSAYIEKYLDFSKYPLKYHKEEEKMVYRVASDKGSYGCYDREEMATRRKWELELEAFCDGSDECFRIETEQRKEDVA